MGLPSHPAKRPPRIIPGGTWRCRPKNGVFRCFLGVTNWSESSVLTLQFSGARDFEPYPHLVSATNTNPHVRFGSVFFYKSDTFQIQTLPTSEPEMSENRLPSGKLT
jgi:hypothetical protein